MWSSSDRNSKQVSAVLQKLKLSHIDATDKYGNTALHLTLKSQKLTHKQATEISKILLDSGIDPDTKNKDNETALHLAVSCMNKDVIDCLMKAQSTIHSNSVTHFFIRSEYAKLQRKSAQKDTSDCEMHKDEFESACFVEWLVSKGFDFDEENEEKRSALLLAIEYNLQHILPVLLMCTKTIDFVNEEEQTLLHLFLRYNNINRHFYTQRYAARIVKILLDRGVSVDAEDVYKFTPVRLAIKKQEDIKIIQILLERCTRTHFEAIFSEILLQAVMISPSSTEHVLGKTEYYVEILRSIVAKNVKIDELINKSDEHGETPLCNAVTRQNPRVINFLLQNGADFEVTTMDGENLLHLLANGEDSSDAIDDAKRLYDLLIVKGCQVNARDIYGNTPLHDAATRGNVTIARKLLEHGAEVNCQTPEGVTPLRIAAVERRSSRMVELLGEYGADFKVTTRLGQNLLHLLAAKNFDDEELTLLLVDKGCDVRARDATGATPIHVAAIHSSSFVVRALIEAGADVNCRNDRMETPLHLATTNRDVLEVLRLLLRRKANVNAKDAEGRTAVHKVVTGTTGQQSCAVLWCLLEHGADVNVEDGRNLTALSHARSRDSLVHEQNCREYARWHNGILMDEYNRRRGGFLRSLYDPPPELLRIEECPLEDVASFEVIALTQHSIKLKVAGLPWDSRINGPLGDMDTGTEIYCEKYAKRCSKEIEKLKSALIDDGVSLYRFLHMSADAKRSYLNNEKLLKIVCLETVREEFFEYWQLILAAYREGTMRRSLLEPAKEAWFELTGIELPDLCLECVFSFLSNTELFGIIERNEG